MLTLQRSVMPKQSIKDLPPEPKRRRRSGRDLYEVLAVMLWFTFLITGMVLMILSKGGMTARGYVFTWAAFSEIVYVMFAFWIGCSVAIFMFDRNAIKRETQEYEYHKKNYRDLRDNILALENEKIEIEKKRLAINLERITDE